MKHIQFRSTEGQLRVAMPDAGGKWNDGEIKPLSDEDAAVALMNKQFHDVTPGVADTTTAADEADED